MKEQKQSVMKVNIFNQEEFTCLVAQHIACGWKDHTDLNACFSCNILFICYFFLLIWFCLFYYL